MVRRIFLQNGYYHTYLEVHILWYYGIYTAKLRFCIVHTVLFIICRFFYEKLVHPSNHRIFFLVLDLFYTTTSYKMSLASEKTPLIIPSGIVPPSNAVGEQPTVYFLERRESMRDPTPINMSQTDAEEIETIPDGSTTDQFSARPMTVTGRMENLTATKKSNGLLSFFRNVSRKSNAFAAASNTGIIDSSAILPRSAPVKVDPKVFFANERTFLAWLHVSVILAGASVAIVAFTDSNATPGPGALYGVILLPVSIAFILYAMIQYTRRASMIRRKSPGPYMDIAGPTVLTVILMLSIVTQFSIKLYTLM